MGAGPILIFDKSALQDLPDDEAFLLDALFLSNVVPVFYMEVLADLEKDHRRGVLAADMVSALAEKTPRYNASASAFHGALAIADLQGRPIEMKTGQVVLDRGSLRRASDGSVGFFADEVPEADALWRWQNHEFDEVEKHYAKAWRASLSAVDNSAMAEWAKRMLPPGQTISTLSDARAFVDGFIERSDSHTLEFVLQHLNIAQEHKAAIHTRHVSMGRPPLAVFAPYAAYLFKVNLLYALGMASQWISSKPQNNIIDVSYLYYLPFCFVFVSGDKLHARLVPHLKRPDQEFVWAPHLRSALRELNAYYRARGTRVDDLRAANSLVPPFDLDNVVTRLWDTFLPGWRHRASAPESDTSSAPDFLERSRASEILPEDWPEQPEFFVISKRVPPQRRQWRDSGDPVIKSDRTL
ncbi:MAG: hypothetical protein ACREV5_19725 [Steroidobacter sp.]